MNLDNLQWPTPSESVNWDRQKTGFGGTLRAPSGTAQYLPVGNPVSAQGEVRRHEQLEAPLPVKEEEKQSLIDTPSDVKDANKQEKEQHALPQQQELKRKSEVTWASVAASGRREEGSTAKKRKRGGIY